MTTATNLQTSSLAQRTPIPLVAAVACAFALALDMIEMAIGNVLATVFAAQPDRVSSDELSWLLSSVYIGAVLGAPAIGWISDRRGIRVCLAASLVWLALASCLAGASETVFELTLFRFLSGLSLGAIPPLLIAYLTRIAPVQSRGALIFWVCGSAALVPPFALLLIRWVIGQQPFGIEGWRWPLYAAGVSAMFVGGVFFGLKETAVETHESTREDALQPVDAGSKRMPHGRFAFLASIYFLAPWATVGFPVLTGPILLSQGYDLSQALLYVTLATVGPSLGSFVTTSFVDRFDRRVILAGCALAMMAAVAVFALARSPANLASALIVFGVATAIFITALTIYAAESFTASVRTFATSSAWAINRAASAIVPVILLPLLNAHSVFISMLPICVALAASLALIALFGPEGAARRVVS
jgi:MFS transporter, putative metabolite:H+ symporter